MTEPQYARERRTIPQTLARVVRAPLTWQILGLVLLGIATRYWLGSQTDAARRIRSTGSLAPLITVTLQCLTSMTPVGSSLIPTLNGMLFPVLAAMGLNMASGLITGVALYYFWSRRERDLHIQKRLDSLPPWARRFARDDLRSLIIMRMLPWAGANISTFLAGTNHVPLRVHIASVFVGSLPGSIIYALLGAGIVRL
ncbi:MAG TPA: VTT domain-containing protein [Candidatus Krumholzibacteria bacterium]|nr:VTT domain-containing protein [Candidatus Krumholzibacteria bacterium]